MSTRAKYYRINRPAVDALGAVNKHITNIDPKLRALVELRVSQINGCGYCIDLHSTHARSHGETQQRLDCLPAWWETDFFEPAEEAAFRWAEALTHVSTTHAPEDVYQALTAHFSEAQIVDLSLVISMMNAWNRLAIGHHSRPAKRAES
ncbi:MAG TPA: carboxymuconolactone decarboxylase family protein [Pirellulales bacterium]|nr:carboxymuconolactone decarboxylase family protein [Pirellulales bacterium]